jgi:hypothetical protein
MGSITCYKLEVYIQEIEDSWKSVEVVYYEIKLSTHIGPGDSGLQECTFYHFPRGLVMAWTIYRVETLNSDELPIINDFEVKAQWNNPNPAGTRDIGSGIRRGYGGDGGSYSFRTPLLSHAICTRVFYRQVVGSASLFQTSKWRVIPCHHFVFSSGVIVLPACFSVVFNLVLLIFWRLLPDLDHSLGFSIFSPLSDLAYFGHPTLENLPTRLSLDFAFWILFGLDCWIFIFRPGLLGFLFLVYIFEPDADNCNWPGLLLDILDRAFLDWWSAHVCGKVRFRKSADLLHLSEADLPILKFILFLNLCSVV